MAITKPAVLPVWADSGDKVQPSNTEIQTGWPLSNVPPARQRFNWFFNYVSNAVRYFSRRGLPDWDAAETYMIGDTIIGDDNKLYRSKVNSNFNKTPSASPTEWGTDGFGSFPPGTRLIFPQAAAPTGWTQVTTHDNKALRVVNSTGGGSGGSVAFTTAFAVQATSGTVGGTALDVSQIPSHTHNFSIYPTTGSGAVPSAGVAAGAAVMNTTDGGTGGGLPHSHGFTGNNIDMRVQYVDVIIAEKD